MQSVHVMNPLKLNIPAIFYRNNMLYTGTLFIKAIIDDNGNVKVERKILCKDYLSRIANNEPYVVIQSIDDKAPWNEMETIPSENELKGRYASGPSFYEIFKQYIKATGERMEIHRLFYYAHGKV